MSGARDPFSKWRERRKPPAALAPAAAGPLASYRVNYVNRGWAILLLFAWMPIMLALIVWMVMNERVIKDAVSWGTGLMVLCMLTLLASLVVVPMAAASRRVWTLFADRLEIVQRPFVPLLGPYRRASLPLGEIAAARMGEALNGMQVFEIEAQAGGRYRLAPRHLGKGRNVYLDHGGFADFVDGIGAAIVAAGHPRPPGERLKMPGNGFSGVAILSVITALLGALCVFGLWAALSGESVGVQALALGVPLTALFAGLLRNRWTKWRAQVAESRR